MPAEDRYDHQAEIAVEAKSAAEALQQAAFGLSLLATPAAAQDTSNSDGNQISKQTALTEKSEMVNGRRDEPNMHDILTGSTPEGTVAAGQTCSDWMSNSSTDTAIVEHHDRMGLKDDSKSWNSSHRTRGCSKEDLPNQAGQACSTALLKSDAVDHPEHSTGTLSRVFALESLDG